MKDSAMTNDDPMDAPTDSYWSRDQEQQFREIVEWF